MRRSSPIIAAASACLLLGVLGVLGCEEDRRSADVATDEQEVPYPEYRSAMNVAAGLMNRFEFREAEDAYRQIVAKWGGSRDARRNLAIAILNQSEEGAQERAIEMLDAAMTDWAEADGGKRPMDLSARYATALCLLYLGRHREARDIFIECGHRAPTDPYAAFFAGQCLELDGRYEEALDWYERSIELDGYLRSPLLGAQRCLARLDREVEGEPLLDRFLALADNPRGKLAEFKYTRMGRLGEVRTPRAVSPPDGPPSGPLFAAETTMPIEGVDPAAETTVRPAADLDGDGVLDFLLTARSGDEGPVVSLALSDRGPEEASGWGVSPMRPASEECRTAELASARLFWADFDNDGRTDVAASPRDGGDAFWLRQREGPRWSRESFGTATGRLLAAADVDHDGDVDLVVTGESGSGFLLNRSDGDEEAATSWRARALENSIANASAATLGDFDDDGDLDLMLLDAEAPAQVWINDLLWSWRRDARYRPIESAQPAEAVWFRDDDTGRPQLVGLVGDAGRRELAIWTLHGNPCRREEVADGDRPAPRARDLAVIDVAGSGRSNILWFRDDAAGDRATAVLELRDVRGGRIEEVRGLSPGATLAVPDARGPVLVSGPGGDGPPRWQDAGVGRMPFVAIRFSGRTDPSQQMRSNASGIGTRGDARTFDSWQSRTLLPWRSGSNGQPLEPVLYGLGGSNALDWLAIEWPDGVLQSELDLDAGTETVSEIQRQISSCPVIFAWNGTRFEFKTDALGVGGMGYLAVIEEADDGLLTPGYPTPRPLESVLLGEGDAIAPRNGRFEIRLGEPMEEACYLDAARLAAWDLPPGWSMTLDERMAIGGPAPTGEARFFRRSMTPEAATVSVGAAEAEDVLIAVSEADFVAADPGPHDERFIGRTRSIWTLTARFPQAIVGDGGEPTLLIDGWVEYPYSSTSFAMWQADRLPEPPSLEALDPASGEWVVLVDPYGYPAGMPRQASFPIPVERLPAGCVSLRLRTSNEIYIDRLAIAWIEPCPDARRVDAPLVAASVADAGFAHRPALPQRRPWYDYDRRIPLWDVRLQQGFYTAFGDCTPLLEATDDAVAIFGGGEEIRLEFGADLPASRPGWRRNWVLELDGWCKDMDPYTGLGAALKPLPLRQGSVSTPRREELHRRFNTRFAAGR